MLGLGASYLRTLLRDPREDPNWVPEGEDGGVRRAEAVGPVAADSRDTGSGTAGERRVGVVADFIGNFRTFGLWALATPGMILFMIVINLPAITSKLLESYFSVYVTLRCR